jgi:nucleotide-binding universal stress UspA family protein
MKHPHAESQHLQAPVICAVDASEEGEAVVCAGARLAALTGAALVLFHVARGEGRWHGLDRLLHADRQASDRAEAYALLLEERAAGVPVVATLELSTGFPTEEVLLAAEDMDPALLVMGSRGQGALQTLLGSVSREVTKDTSRPTLIVPEGADTKLLGGGAVLCGVDDSDQSRRAARVAAGLAAAFGSELIVLSVLAVIRTPAAAAPAAMPAVPEPPDVSPESEDALRARAERVAERLRAIAPVRVIVDVGDPATRLSLVAEEFDAALIAVGSVHRSLLASAVTGSVASARIRESSHPVLLVP